MSFINYYTNVSVVDMIFNKQIVLRDWNSIFFDIYICTHICTTHT
uniref:Uncharacterized protein n=1 Tax=viral metagenome TaxID=1070528 RepID=A0A6C0LZB7_9ZZZZ